MKEESRSSTQKDPTANRQTKAFEKAQKLLETKTIFNQSDFVYPTYSSMTSNTWAVNMVQPSNIYSFTGDSLNNLTMSISSNS